MPGRDRCDERLGAVAARHPENVGAPGDRFFGELEQVVPLVQDDRLDSPLRALIYQVKSLSFSAAGLQVHDQDGIPGRGGTLE